MDITTLFFQLLQVAVGSRESLSRVPSASEWGELYALSEKHSVVGVCWGGIERLPKDRLPNMDLLMDWLGQAEYTKTQNDAVNSAVEETFQHFNGLGIRGVLLKGQGIGQLYPNPELRTSGDIDFLVIEPDIQRIIELAHKNNLDYIHATYHHCDYGKIADVEVEAHWRASWFYTPWYNKRFQEFTQEQINATEGLYPSVAFNRVYVLVHIYRHLFFEGIGLRQILDYYFVLVASSKGSKGSKGSNGNPFWPQERIETMQRLKELGMARFTAAMMWVLSECLKLKDEYLLCEPNEKDGRLLLAEIMRSGNFGKHDERQQYDNYKRGKLNIGYALGHVKRLLHLFKFGPSEILCAPFWKMWHMWYWMPRHNK